MHPERRAFLHYLWPQLAQGRGTPGAAQPTAGELRWSVHGELRTIDTFAAPHPCDFPGGLPVPPGDV
jgi:hypothetical protein